MNNDPLGMRRKKNNQIMLSAARGLISLMFRLVTTVTLYIAHLL